MSKYIDEIIKDIRTNPELWRRYKGSGLQKGKITITQTGNGHKFFFGWGTSIVSVFINGDTAYSTTWRDHYRLEQIVIWWNRNASLSMMKNE